MSSARGERTVVRSIPADTSAARHFRRSGQTLGRDKGPAWPGGGRGGRSGSGAWAVLGEQVVWGGDWLGVSSAEVSTPGGQRFAYDVVRSRWDHAGCLVVNDAGRVMLVRRHRFITDRWGWELPGGGVGRGVDVVDAVARRVVADCGWSIHSPEVVWSLADAPDLTDRVGHLVWAGALSCLGPPNTEAVAQVGWFDLPELRELLAHDIHDLFTMAALMWLLALSLGEGNGDASP